MAAGMEPIRTHGAAASGPGLAELVDRVRRHAVPAVAASALTFALLAAGILSLQPRYEAEGLLLLPSASVDDPRTGASVVRASQTDPFLIQSEMDVLTSDEVVRRTVQRLGLERDPAFVGPDAAEEAASVPAEASDRIRPEEADARLMDAAVRSYRKGFGAYNDGRSRSAHVSFTGPDPVLASRIVNAHAEVYVEMQVTRRRDAQQRVVDLLDVELARQQAALERSEQALGGVDAGRTASAAEAARLARLRSDLRQAQVGVAQVGARRDEAAEALRNGVLQSGDLVATDARLASPASVPIRKSFPRNGLFLAVAAVLAAAAGIGAALLADAFATGLAGVREFADSAGIRILGSAPLPSRLVRFGRWRERPFWEQIRFVRDHVALADGTGTAILITSSVPREGKSLAASALAQAYAAARKRTLLVDADIRMASSSGGNAPAGLADVLAGNCSVDDVVVAGPGGLDLMPAGAGGGGYDVLASGEAAAVLAELRRRYDVVVLDSPPVVAVSDAILIARHVDAAVFVVRRSTPHRIVANVASLLRGSGVRLEGILVTGLARSDVRRVESRALRRYSRGPAPFLGITGGFATLLAAAPGADAADVVPIQTLDREVRRLAEAAE